MVVRESLVDIIKVVSIAHQSGTLDIQFDSIVDRLEALIEPAIEKEVDAVRYLISLLNLLYEIRLTSFPPTLLKPFFEEIAKALDRPASSAHNLQGEEVQAETSPEVRRGCTMMKWDDFANRYAPLYGVARSTSDLEELWGSIQKGELSAPRDDLHLSSSSGIIWITDEDALYGACWGANPGKLDGTRAYDALGLDWENGWLRSKPIPEMRAIVITAPISYRRGADRGLRVPTSLDAWGSFGFVPKEAVMPRTWPSNAGTTVDPTSGLENLPEAVHGSVIVAFGAACPILPCTPVQKAVPNRVAECGRMVCKRAISALRGI